MNMILEDDVLILRPAGDLHDTEMDRMRAAVSERLGDARFPCILNLRQVTYVSSGGLGGVVALFRQLQQAGSVLVVCELSEPVRELFGLAGVDRLLTLTGSETEAVDQARTEQSFQSGR